MLCSVDTQNLSQRNLDCLCNARHASAVDGKQIIVAGEQDPTISWKRGGVVLLNLVIGAVADDDIGQWNTSLITVDRVRCTSKADQHHCRIARVYSKVERTADFDGRIPKMTDRRSSCELASRIEEIGRREDLAVRVVDRFVAIG